MNEAARGDQCSVDRDSCERESPSLAVYYDGACPLCRREIGFYRRRRGAAAVEWIDISVCDDATLAPGLTRADALARFHVRLRGGQLQSGARGFGELWSALPGFRWLGRIARNRAVAPILEKAYLAFLKLRPALQGLAASRAMRRGHSSPPD